jgi:predicted phosphodiesterase
MKLGIASDIHMEIQRRIVAPYSLDLTSPGVDVLILAGDIDCGSKLIDSIRELSLDLPDTDIIVVAGNHEYYHGHYDNLLREFRTNFAWDDRIHFLEKEAVEIGGYRFLGCTLWSGFDCLGERRGVLAERMVQNNINDFCVIRRDTGVFVPRDIKGLYQESRAWLQDELAKGNPEKTVVISHFPPSRLLRHPAFPEDDMTTYFNANCDDLMQQFQPALWVYGHNHHSDDQVIHGVRCVSHQCGYPNEELHEGVFKPKVLKL